MLPSFRVSSPDFLNRISNFAQFFHLVYIYETNTVPVHTFGTLSETTQFLVLVGKPCFDAVFVKAASLFGNRSFKT